MQKAFSSSLRAAQVLTVSALLKSSGPKTLLRFKSSSANIKSCSFLHTIQGTLLRCELQRAWMASALVCPVAEALRLLFWAGSAPFQFSLDKPSFLLPQTLGVSYLTFGFTHCWPPRSSSEIWKKAFLTPYSYILLT